MTLYAKWNPATYTVVLNTNEGVIAEGKNVTTYTFGVGAKLPTATEITKEGFTFGGWFDNEKLEGNAVTEILATDKGNKTYWAKWTAVEPNPNPVNPDDNGGSGSSSKSAGSSSSSKSAKTGDDLSMVLFPSLLLIISAGVLVTLISRRRRD